MTYVFGFKFIWNQKHFNWFMAHIPLYHIIYTIPKLLFGERYGLCNQYLILFNPISNADRIRVRTKANSNLTNYGPWNQVTSLKRQLTCTKCVCRLSS